MSTKWILQLVLGFFMCIHAAEACTSVAIVTGYVMCNETGAVDNANVTVVCLNNSMSANTNTGQSGSYFAPVCCPEDGRVRIRAEKDGFVGITREGTLKHTAVTPQAEVNVGVVRSDMKLTIPEYPSYALGIIISMTGIGYAIKNKQKYT